MLRKILGLLVVSFLSVLALIISVSCEDDTGNEGALFTVVEKDSNRAETFYLESFGLNPQASILYYRTSKGEGSKRSLTKGFYSASNPNVNFNGKSMVFSAQQRDTDVWQIYEMNLESGDFGQLTNSETNCLSPVYLPDGSIVFSKEIQEGVENDYALFKINKERKGEERITFTPGSYFVLSTLHDGRIICAKISTEQNELSHRKLLVMRPDGTKEMLFSKNTRELVRAGVESTEGAIYLFESDGNASGSVYGLNYNDPLHTKTVLSEKVGDEIMAMSFREPGQMLLSLEGSEMLNQGVYELDIKSDSLVGPIFSDNNLKVIGIAAIQKREVPKKIPSEVNLKEETALLLCQDAGFYGFKADDSKAGKAVKLEVMGKGSSLGIVDLEADGSVYLKLQADTPFRLQTLDADNKVVNGPSSWINLRPNERRACTGCHQGNDLVPYNKQPLAVTKEPIEIPRPNQLLANQD